MKTNVFLLLYFFVSLIAYNQNVRSVTDRNGLLLSNTGERDTLSLSSVIEIRSNNRAFYPPRMPSDSISKIPNPRIGAVIYDTDKKSIRVFNGTIWEMNSLPKSVSVLSEYYPNDTILSAGYKYEGRISVGRSSVLPHISYIRTIPSDGAPYYNNSPDFVGIWGEDKLFITTPSGSVSYYDALLNIWNTIPNMPTLNNGATIIYRGTLSNKYVLIASDYTVYVYSIGSNFWSTFNYPASGNSSITKVANKLVFWKIGTNTINVFTGNRWYNLKSISELPADARTLEYNQRIVFLWNQNGVINGRAISVDDVGTNPAYQSPFTYYNAPMSRDNYAFKVLGNKLIIWGGANSSTFTKTGGVYDFSNNTWTTINPNGAPGEMNGLGIDSYMDKIVIYGSVNISGGIQNGSGGIYDLNTQGWSLINNSTVSGYFPTMFVNGNFLYFWNGYISVTTNIIRYFQRYNFNTQQWEGASSVSFGFGVNIWTGKYFIEWGGYFGVNSNVTYTFSSGGNIYGSESFETSKKYYVYKKE